MMDKQRKEKEILQQQHYQQQQNLDHSNSDWSGIDDTMLGAADHAGMDLIDALTREMEGDFHDGTHILNEKKQD
jgi:hypothetical protein